MGAWGTGVFENDYAMDWLAELTRADDPDFPVSVLRVLGDGRPLSPRESAVGLAAGEVVAASCGVASADLPGKVRSWLEGTGARADAQALQLASGVAGAILDQHAGSPEEHEESGDSLASWLAPVQDLRHRLRTAQPGPPMQSSGGAQSPRRLLEELAGHRGPSGTRVQPGTDQAEYAWRKVRGGVLFSIHGQRGLAVTLDTSGRLAVEGGTGLRRHAPLYVWDPDGTRPSGREFSRRTRCPVFEVAGYHWDDQADPATAENLVDQWVADGGNDEVIWAGLDRELSLLTRLFEDCVHRVRSAMITRLEQQGHTEEAAALGTWDLPRLEARLVASERRRIAAERDRRIETARRYRRRMDEIDARSAQDPDDREPAAD